MYIHCHFDISGTKKIPSISSAVEKNSFAECVSSCSSQTAFFTDSMYCTCMSNSDFNQLTNYNAGSNPRNEIGETGNLYGKYVLTIKDKSLPLS